VVLIMNGEESRGIDEVSLKSTADCISNSFMHVEGSWRNRNGHCCDNRDCLL